MNNNRSSFIGQKNCTQRKAWRILGYGVSGDFGLSLNFLKTKFFIEGGGNYGFININKKAENGNIHTEAVYVRIGICYKIGEVLPIIFK